jgi:hypothetical protein
MVRNAVDAHGDGFNWGGSEAAAHFFSPISTKANSVLGTPRTFTMHWIRATIHSLTRSLSTASAAPPYCIDAAEVQHQNANQRSPTSMTDPVDLTQLRGALVDARILECGAILTDAIDLMWDAGADPSEIVQTLRWAVERIEAANDCQIA